MKKLIGIITGDIVHSRQVEKSIWLTALEEILSELGKSNHNWQIFRGDSFQLRTEATESLRHALLIKARIKQIRGLDVRMGIGIGNGDFSSDIRTSMGEAYLNSGSSFDNLRKNRLEIKTGNKDWDEEMNLYFALASLSMDNWKSATATDIKASLLAFQLNQSEIAEMLGKSQGTLSENLRRGGYDEIRRLLLRYEKRIAQL